MAVGRPVVRWTFGGKFDRAFFRKHGFLNKLEADMAFEHYIQNGARKPRCGYTTGTCAALAAAGAAEQLLTGQAPERVSLVTPKGWQVEAELLHTALVGGVSTAPWPRMPEMT